MKNLNDLQIGKWIPDYCMIRTEFGWKLPNELTKKEQLLVKENNKVKGVYPKNYYQLPYKGKMLGSGKIIFKPSDKIVNPTDEWFEVNNFIKQRVFEVEEIEFEGVLYSFDIDPIVSYEYRVSKVNNNNLLKLEYIV